MKIHIILLPFLVFCFTYAQNLSQIKLQWFDTKIVKLTKIIEISQKEYDLGRLPFNDLITWNEKLFQTKKEKLELGKINLSKESYHLKLLSHFIEKVNFYDKTAISVKSLLEVGLFYKVDLLYFEIMALEAYANYEYTLSQYKKLYPNSKIVLKLPNNLENKITELSKE